MRLSGHEGRNSNRLYRGAGLCPRLREISGAATLTAGCEHGWPFASAGSRQPPKSDCQDFRCCSVANHLIHLRVLFAFLLLAAMAGFPGAMADPLGGPSSPQKVLPDPVPDAGVNFSHSLATSEVAQPPEKLSSLAEAPNQACSPLSPCALPPPALGDSDGVRYASAATNKRPGDTVRQTRHPARTRAEHSPLRS